MFRWILSSWVMVLWLAQAANADYVKVSDDLTIHYEEAGSGDTVILFAPGWTMSTEVFAKQLERFKDSTDYRFITYDPRGQGLSSKTEGGHYYLQHGRDLNAFIQALGLQNIVLGGWSYGTNEVLAYVNQFGADALKGFVIIDGSPKATGQDNATEWVWYRHDDADGFEQFFTMGPLVDRQGTNVEFAKWMLEDQSEANIDWVLGITNQTSDSVAALLNAAATFDDFTADLKAMEGKIPLLYVVREEWDQVVSAWAQEHTPSATVVAMGKHLMFWERPAEFNAALDRFLKTLK